MLPSDTTILEMYETLGLTVDQISTELGYDSVAVKMSLLQNSPKYSKDNRIAINSCPGPAAQTDIYSEFPIFDEQDESMAKGVLRDLARNGELEIVRLSSAKTILKLNQEERASKRATQIGKTTFNINLIQERLDKAKRATTLVEVESQKVLETV